MGEFIFVVCVCPLRPVPDLPGKSFFSFRHEDFLERRRQGLQIFLDKSVLFLESDLSRHRNAVVVRAHCVCVLVAECCT